MSHRLLCWAALFGLGCTQPADDCVVPQRGAPCPAAEQYGTPAFGEFERGLPCPAGARRDVADIVLCVLYTRVCAPGPDIGDDECGLEGYVWSPSRLPSSDLPDGVYAYGLDDGAIVSCRDGQTAKILRLWQRLNGSLYHASDPESDDDAPFIEACGY